VAASLSRSAAELGLAAADGAPLVAVLSGGNIDPGLLARVLSAEATSYNR
jgi:threonine dehydratase